MALVRLHSQLKKIMLYKGQREGNYRAWFAEGFKSDACTYEGLGCQCKVENSGVIWQALSQNRI